MISLKQISVFFIFNIFSIHNKLTYKLLTGRSLGALTTSGKWACLGNQQDNDMTPANGSGYVRAACKARDPPWENPPNKIRLVGIPP